MPASLRKRALGPAAGCVVAVAAAAAIVAIASRDGSGGPLRFAYQNRIGSAACILAVEKGLFADEGLEVEAFRFASGPACAEALYSGSADIGTMGDTTAVIAASRGAPLTIIASHGRGEHRHRLVARPDSPIRGASDLVGRTVAVKKGTSTYGGFLAFLRRNRVEAAKVRIVDMRPSEMPDALLAGSIDAFVASEPTPSLAESRGARQVATMGGLGNTYPILVLASDRLLAERPGDVRRFLRALHRGVLFAHQHPDEAADVLAAVTGLTPEVARQAMKRHAYSLSLDDAIIDSLAATAAFLKEQRQIDSLPDFRRAADGRHLRAALE